MHKPGQAVASVSPKGCHSCLGSPWDTEAAPKVAVLHPHGLEPKNCHFLGEKSPAGHPDFGCASPGLANLTAHINVSWVGAQNLCNNCDTSLKKPKNNVYILCIILKFGILITTLNRQQ